MKSIDEIFYLRPERYFSLKRGGGVQQKTQKSILFTPFTGDIIS